jgi:hypothetical protein
MVSSSERILKMNSSSIFILKIKKKDEFNWPLEGRTEENILNPRSLNTVFTKSLNSTEFKYKILSLLQSDIDLV